MQEWPIEIYLDGQWKREVVMGCLEFQTNHAIERTNAVQKGTTSFAPLDSFKPFQTMECVLGTSEPPNYYLSKYYYSLSN